MNSKSVRFFILLTSLLTSNLVCAKSDCFQSPISEEDVQFFEKKTTIIRSTQGVFALICITNIKEGIVRAGTQGGNKKLSPDFIKTDIGILELQPRLTPFSGIRPWIISMDNSELNQINVASSTESATIIMKKAKENEKTISAQDKVSGLRAAINLQYNTYIGEKSLSKVFTKEEALNHSDFTVQFEKNMTHNIELISVMKK